MSFFQPNYRGVRPGPIHGDPCRDLCNRVAICARRVLDSALLREQQDNAQLLLENVRVGVTPTTFVEAITTTPTPTINNLRIDRIKERPNFARIQATLTIPLVVEFIDQDGMRETATSYTTEDIDIILSVPKESIFPFEVAAQCAVQSTTGTINATTRTASATLCINTSMKIIAESDIMIPAFGFAPSPRAVNFTEDVCRNFFELPLFPTSR